MLTSGEILQMKKVTDLTHSAKKTNQVSDKGRFQFGFWKRQTPDVHFIHLMLLKLWKKQFWQHSLEQQQEDESLLSALQGFCQEYQSHGNDQGYGVLLTGCWVKTSTNHREWLLCSHTNPQNLLPEQDLCSHTKTTNIFTISPVPVPLLHQHLLKDKTLLKTLSKPHELFLSKARKGFLKMYQVWWTQPKGNSTFKVLVGAQPVPSIECSLNKLEKKRKKDIYIIQSNFWLNCLCQKPQKTLGSNCKIRSNSCTIYIQVMEF